MIFISQFVVIYVSLTLATYLTNSNKSTLLCYELQYPTFFARENKRERTITLSHKKCLNVIHLFDLLLIHENAHRFAVRGKRIDREIGRKGEREREREKERKRERERGKEREREREK